MKQLFQQDAPWYRGNLHTHTTLSDGKASPEEAVALYRAQGYSFLCVTDHRVYYEAREEEGFTLLRGVELDNNDYAARKAWHIVGIGMEGPARHIRGDTAQMMVDCIREAGGLAVLAHPHWSLLEHRDMLDLTGIFATEIYSGNSESFTGRGDSSQYVDTCMSKGCPRMLLGVDDTHFYTGDLFRAWIMLQAPSLARGDILASLEAGRFYATEGGPDFRQITVGSESITVECGSAARIAFYSDLFWCEDRIHPGPLAHAEYRIKPRDNYVRIVLTGADGKRSTSQYIPVNQGEKEGPAGA